MVRTFSVGLKQLSAAPHPEREILITSFSTGLKNSQTRKYPNRFLIKSLSLGMGEGFPAEINIYRNRSFDKE